MHLWWWHIQDRNVDQAMLICLKFRDFVNTPEMNVYLFGCVLEN